MQASRGVRMRNSSSGKSATGSVRRPAISTYSTEIGRCADGLCGVLFQK